MLSDDPVFPILLSTDLDASRSFYRDTLGLELMREDIGDRLVFRCGGGTQIAITLSTIGTSDTQTQMAWRVPDLKAAVAEVRARGVRPACESDRRGKGKQKRNFGSNVSWSAPRTSRTGSEKTI